MTKKLGGAVVRNRIRRRLRAALAELASAHADPCFDYVVVARQVNVELPYAKLRDDLALAFERVHLGPKQMRRQPGTGGRRSVGEAKSPPPKRAEPD